MDAVTLFRMESETSGPGPMGSVGGGRTSTAKRIRSRHAAQHRRLNENTEFEQLSSALPIAPAIRYKSRIQKRGGILNTSTYSLQLAHHIAYKCFRKMFFDSLSFLRSPMVPYLGCWPVFEKLQLLNTCLMNKRSQGLKARSKNSWAKMLLQQPIARQGIGDSADDQLHSTLRFCPFRLPTMAHWSLRSVTHKLSIHAHVLTFYLKISLS